MTEILGLTASAARKTGEIGFLIGALGALLLLAAGTRFRVRAVWAGA